MEIYSAKFGTWQPAPKFDTSLDSTDQTEEFDTPLDHLRPEPDQFALEYRFFSQDSRIPDFTTISFRLYRALNRNQ